MGNKSALVVGGTGPTVPGIVNGLPRRGYDVTILHRGTHEVEFDGDVAHIHADPNFADGLRSGLASKPWWDLVVFSYGRLNHGVELAKGRTGRFIAIGGNNPAPKTDPRTGLLGRDRANGASCAASWTAGAGSSCRTAGWW